MVAGSHFGISDNNPPSDHESIADEKIITSLMDSKGITWKAYMESMPTPCAKSSDDLYVVRHNPFMYFKSVTSDDSYCASHVVDSKQLRTDLSDDNLPNFAFVVPNLKNGGHDTSISFADSWLSEFLPDFIEAPSFANSVIFISFDEDDITESNHIYTAVLGPPTIVKHEYKSEKKYDHYSLSATIEEIFSLGNLGRDDAKAETIGDVFHESALPSKESKDYYLKIGGNETEKIRYQITGAELSSFVIRANSSSINAKIKPVFNGMLTVELPRHVIQAQSNGRDIDYQVLIDGRKAHFEEADPSADNRILSIGFNLTSDEIEIVGTSVIPEFPYPLTILAFSSVLLAVVLSTSYKRLFFGTFERKYS